MSEQARGPRAVAVPTSDRRDYLKKRHMREGPRRRKFGVSDALDVELDARNARVWGSVLMSMRTVAGIAPGEIIRMADRGAGAERHHRVIRAALWVCHWDYGIPVGRLYDLSGNSRQRIGVWVKDHDGARPLVQAWRLLGGPDTVDKVECVPVLITKEAALALAKAARESGDSPIALASAAVLAAAHRTGGSR